MEGTNRPQIRTPWNKGKLVGQKAPFKAKEVWGIRARLEMDNAPGNWCCSTLLSTASSAPAISVKLRVRDVCHGYWIASRATVLQQKTQRPVQFEISPATREAVEAWIRKAGLRSDDYLFPSWVRPRPTSALASTPAFSTGGVVCRALPGRLRYPNECGAPRRL